jgi:hypothetical protein
MRTINFSLKKKTDLKSTITQCLVLVLALLVTLGCNQKMQLGNLFDRQTNTDASLDAPAKSIDEGTTPPGSEAPTVPGSDEDNDNDDSDPDLGSWPVQAPEPTLLNPPVEFGSDFKNEISTCRTFCFLHELGGLHKLRINASPTWLQGLLGRALGIICFRILHAIFPL